jgi:hypothetical protein
LTPDQEAFVRQSNRIWTAAPSLRLWEECKRKRAQFLATID